MLFIFFIHIDVHVDCFLHVQYTGADSGFCVRGDENRRWVWGPLKVSSWSRAR